MLWDGTRVPFTLLGGYLGAGKTTIVNHVIARSAGRRIVVLVNDLGAVNIDAALIAEHDGATLTLTNGCVCCTIADDVTQTLEQVRGMREPPDHVVMEMSGVAEPARVVPWASTPGFRLDGVVIAADADQIVAFAERVYIGDTIVAQLAAADVVLLTKIDQAAPAAITAARRLVATHTGAPIVAVARGKVDVEILMGIGRPDAEPDAEQHVDRDSPTTELPRSSHISGLDEYETEIIEVGDITFDDLSQLVSRLPADVVRAKGLIACVGRSEPIEAHVIGRRRSVAARPDLPLDRAGPHLVVIRHVR